MEKGETFKMPKLLHHLFHDRINMEFAEACMRAMLWHRQMYAPVNQFDAYLDSEEYKANADRAIKAYFQGQSPDAGTLQAVSRYVFGTVPPDVLLL